MSYRVMLKVSLDNSNTITRLLMLHQQLQASGLKCEVATRSRITDMLDSDRGLLIRSEASSGYVHVQKVTEGDGYSVSYDGDYDSAQDHANTVAHLHPHRFFTEPFGRGVSRFYQQAHVIDRLEQDGLRWESADSFKDANGLWCPGNVRSYQASSNSEMVSTSW